MSQSLSDSELQFPACIDLDKRDLSGTVEVEDDSMVQEDAAPELEKPFVHCDSKRMTYECLKNMIKPPRYNTLQTVNTIGSLLGLVVLWYGIYNTTLQQDTGIVVRYSWGIYLILSTTVTMGRLLHQLLLLSLFFYAVVTFKRYQRALGRCRCTVPLGYLAELIAPASVATSERTERHLAVNASRLVVWSWVVVWVVWSCMGDASHETYGWLLDLLLFEVWSRMTSDVIDVDSAIRTRLMANITEYERAMTRVDKYAVGRLPTTPL